LEKDSPVYSSRGRIFHSGSKYSGWKLIRDPLYVAQLTSLCCFGELEDGGFWIGGGTGTPDHGYWGSLVRMQQKATKTFRRLRSYNFNDIEYMSHNEFVAVGTLVESVNYKSKRMGVILHSTNAGKNWSTVYTSEFSSAYSSIAKLSEDKVIIAV